jgi:hypothetical protein
MEGEVTSSVPQADHWRNHWNFHQKSDRNNLTEEEIFQKEFLIKELCSERNVQIASPTSANLKEFLEEVVQLLAQNYVEDPDGDFSFVYQSEHLEWFMLPTHHHLDLLIGLREGDSELLVGFLAACPIKLHVSTCARTPTPSEFKTAALVDFVCVHQSRRGERLCPLLYSILDWKLQMKGIDALVKTSGTLLDYPVASVSYYHLILNEERCNLATFSAIPLSDHPRGYEMISKDIVDSFHPLEERHLDSVLELFTRESQKYSLGHVFQDRDHVRHFLMARENIVFTLVRERRSDGEETPDQVTDLVSFYFVPHHIGIPGNPLEGQVLKIGYIFYHMATTLSPRDLLKVAATIASSRFQLDCLNILPIGQMNGLECRRIGAGQGTGKLHYYLNTHVGINERIPSSALLLYPI